MTREIHDYIVNCAPCEKERPVSYGTLFQVLVAPKWGIYIVEYLTMRMFSEGMGKARRRSIKIEAREYAIIVDQLYKRGMDCQLRICDCENEYIVGFAMSAFKNRYRTL